jgi:hypothetical protein
MAWAAFVTLIALTWISLLSVVAFAWWGIVGTSEREWTVTIHEALVTDVHAGSFVVLMISTNLLTVVGLPVLYVVSGLPRGNIR